MTWTLFLIWDMRLDTNSIMVQMASNQCNALNSATDRDGVHHRHHKFFTFGDSQSLLLLGKTTEGGFESLWHHLFASRREQRHVSAVQVYWKKTKQEKSQHQFQVMAFKGISQWLSACTRVSHGWLLDGVKLAHSGVRERDTTFCFLFWWGGTRISCHCLLV